MDPTHASTLPLSQRSWGAKDLLESLLFSVY
ncbi:rCG47319, isoform CRA_a [Rattus norvegicus]|uniref:RCG47319, isoform CRA_a n=1 Tax=Rattus norvegicus TaxID=10116 RepID=A6HZN6_RAT|nr:rCG47319, isoform CRA_a [Rattus norvegicus]